MRRLILALACAAAGCDAIALDEQPTSFAVQASPTVNSFHLTDAPSEARQMHAAARLLDGRILIVGGHSAGKYEWLTRAEIYDPEREQFEDVASTLWPHRNPQLTVLRDGQVLLTGWIDSKVGATSEFFDPVSATFSTGPEVPSAYAGPVTTLLQDGRVLLIGASAGIYDPVSGTITPAGGPTIGMGGGEGRGVALLAGGRVLLAGGPAQSSGGGQHAYAELFDPATGSFVRTGQTKVGRGHLTLTALPDGRALATGGFQSYGGLRVEHYASAEVYDPTTESFTATGSMRAPRVRHTATLLQSGHVLVVGDGAELFDSGTGTFAATSAPITQRSDHTATLLDDGRVLIVGGESATAPASAELYVPGSP